MRRFLRENSLSIVLFMIFLVLIIGQSLVGFSNNNQELEAHGATELTFSEYLTSGPFIEATFENWESEFLQMAAYVLLTIWLRQKGSSESKRLIGTEAVDAPARSTKHAAWPIRRGGIWALLYKNSLSLALLLLFGISFFLHAYGGAQAACVDNLQHNEACTSTIAYMTTNQFWFESLQNWQSEFLAVFTLVVLTIFLRQQGSPESKPIQAANDKTGSE